MAFFAFLDGGFMDYNGADAGDEAFYGQVMRLRRTLPPLKQGTCDYLAVMPTEPMVFAPLWEGNGRYLLPVIHFDSRPARVGLPLPVERMHLTAERFQVVDRMAELALPGPNGVTWSRDELANLSVDVAAYGVLLLDFLPAD